MEVYLVGGAVRDKLMGLEVKDRDWVVVGAKPDDLIALGYTQVGKDFPVFLHPHTKEEYALARTERKIAAGYKGFEFCASDKVSLEDDLLRRDFTINAIAEDKDGNIIDPFGGKKDIENKIMRHVSDAFVEDPVRLLRLARFIARFSDFKVADDTHQLICAMVNSGEVNSLVAERVWAEMVKGLEEESPWLFFDIIKSCGADKVLWPNFFAKNYTDILKRLGKTSADTRFAAIVAACDKSDIIAFARKYKVPNDTLELALVVNKNYKKCIAIDANPDNLLGLLDAIDAWRRPGRIAAVLDAAFAQDGADSNHVYMILGAYKASSGVKASDVITPGMAGKQIGVAISKHRLSLIANFLNDNFS